ncbi:unnamed protein product [Rhizoctonia solani]|uniref:Uncharacterized protein n=1 Tax=Rhizoctonia solani TaxID=456999 RepID=A0A8H3DKK3_9AGAM|nr:unnamed protein product [Rhizoctonia solani]
MADARNVDRSTAADTAPPAGLGSLLALRTALLELKYALPWTFTCTGVLEGGRGFRELWWMRIVILFPLVRSLEWIAPRFRELKLLPVVEDCAIEVTRCTAHWTISTDGHASGPIVNEYAKGQKFMSISRVNQKNSGTAPVRMVAW